MPTDLRDEYPRLQLEMNDKEYDLSLAEYRFMYHKDNEKWKLRVGFVPDWGREA